MVSKECLAAGKPYLDIWMRHYDAFMAAGQYFVMGMAEEDKKAFQRRLVDLHSEIVENYNMKLINESEFSSFHDLLESAAESLNKDNGANTRQALGKLGGTALNLTFDKVIDCECKKHGQV